MSCILFCYLIFPFMYNYIKDISLKNKIISGIILGGILLYSPFLAGYLQIEVIYSNLFFRMLEFVIGMFLCSIWFDVRDTDWYKYFFARRILFVGIFIMLIVLVTILYRMNILVGNYMIYSVVGLPCFSLLLFLGAGIDTPVINSSRLIQYAVDISYVFFFAQFYTWKSTLVIIKIIGMDNNFIRIVISFFVCTIIAIVMHEIVEKNLKRLFSRTMIISKR